MVEDVQNTVNESTVKTEQLEKKAVETEIKQEIKMNYKCSECGWKGDCLDSLEDVDICPDCGAPIDEDDVIDDV